MKGEKHPWVARYAAGDAITTIARGSRVGERRVKQVLVEHGVTLLPWWERGRRYDRIDNISGQRFGRLVAVSVADKRAGATRWLCRCDCGSETVVRKPQLGTRTFSCGCYLKERRIKHGRATGTYDTTYAIWSSMRSRCAAKAGRKWEGYAGRGITVCDRWSDFNNFLADMGERPGGLSLDRIDNDGPYSPENCRWATAIQQMGNTRVARRVVVQGEEMSIAEATRRLQIPISRLKARVAEHGDPSRPCSKEVSLAA